MNQQTHDKSFVKKALRTVAGVLILLVGVIAIPYPGPGWLIVFGGLAILARDYPAARRVLDYGQRRYKAWQAWLERQPVGLKLIFWLVTTVVVVMTIWLLNGYGLINSFFNLGQDWVKSPLVN